MPALLPGSWIYVEAEDWTDDNNRPCTEPLEGEIVKVYAAPWPLLLVDTPEGRRWVHVRRSALEAAVVEEPS